MRKQRRMAAIGNRQSAIGNSPTSLRHSTFRLDSSLSFVLVSLRPPAICQQHLRSATPDPTLDRQSAIATRVHPWSRPGTHGAASSKQGPDSEAQKGAPVNGHGLLARLADAPWDVAVRTYGSSHATLIGVLVHWWVRQNPTRHTVLDSGPSYGEPHAGEEAERGLCDALFCADGLPVGVLEVEGSRPPETARKMGRFLEARYPELESLRFGILLLYAGRYVERGDNRRVVCHEQKSGLLAVQDITNRHRGKPVVVIILGKRYERVAAGIRRRSEYYFGVPNHIKAILYQDGQQMQELEYWHE